MQQGQGKRYQGPSKYEGILVFRCRGTVFPRIWLELLFVLIYTTGVVLLKMYVPEVHVGAGFPDTLMNVLGVVIGLLLVFHTTAAYDRYWEGRQLWSTVTVCVRTLTRGIWLGVKQDSGKDVVEKKSMMNMLVAFVLATKHYIRQEYSSGYSDIKDLLGHLPVFATPASIIPLRHVQLKSEDSQDTITQLVPTLPTRFEAHDFMPSRNIPIEITYYISGYLQDINARGLVDSYTLTSMHEALGKLVECLTAFERILRTPIPLAYSVHLHHSVWIYILALPFQMVVQLEWWTILSVFLAAFCLLGIIGIGWQIENPFGKETNDLPLDDFCEVIRCEIDMITRSRIAKPGKWIHSSYNCPLSQQTGLTAIELGEKPVAELLAMIRGGVTDQQQGIIV